MLPEEVQGHGRDVDQLVQALSDLSRVRSEALAAVASPTTIPRVINAQPIRASAALRGKRPVPIFRTSLKVVTPPPRRRARCIWDVRLMQDREAGRRHGRGGGARNEGGTGADRVYGSEGP